jgi:hypothetical protein
MSYEAGPSSPRVGAMWDCDLEFRFEDGDSQRMEDDSFRRKRPWLGVMKSSVRKGELWRLCTAGEALTELESLPMLGH